MIKYAIQKTMLGGSKVIYQCPTCLADLESKLTEAGSDDKCPHCFNPFTVPGEKELINPHFHTDIV
jgi:hypothetical protein